MRNKILNVNTVLFVTLITGIFIGISMLSPVFAVLPEDTDDQFLRKPTPTPVKGFYDLKKTVEDTSEHLENLTDIVLDISGSPTDNTNNQQNDNTPSQDVDTILDSAEYDTEFGALVQKITRVIHGTCTQFGIGVVKKSNNSCVDGIAPVIGAANGSKTVQHLKLSTSVVNSPGSAYHQTLQCVGCAIAMAQANGKPLNAWGNAVNFADQVVPGYQYVRRASLTQEQLAKIGPGSVFVSKSGTFGHVGVVVDLDRNTAGIIDSFVAQECNWSKPGHFGLGRTVAFDMVDGFQIPL